MAFNRNVSFISSLTKQSCQKLRLKLFLQTKPRNIMHPHIEFSHILNELSVNRNDPCEVIREIISNAYDAAASKILYAPLEEESGFLFFDNGVGLSSDEAINGVTPYEAFFSIGKSTKKKGESIGYKCQGAKLCFAATRILVITRSAKEADWRAIRIENPRQVLNG
jgi:hypothetical protein